MLAIALEAGRRRTDLRRVLFSLARPEQLRRVLSVVLDDPLERSA